MSDSPHVNVNNAVGLITEIKLVWTRDAHSDAHGNFQMERENWVEQLNHALEVETTTIKKKNTFKQLQ